MPVPEYVAPAFSWNGFYIGAHTGVAVGKTTTSNNAPYGGFDAGVPLSYDLNPVSIFGGGQFGYNWQRGVYVFGLEADFGYLGLRETICARAGRLRVARSTAGTAPSPAVSASPYDRMLDLREGRRGGREHHQLGRRSDRRGCVDPTDYSETKKTRWGWTVGSGFEYAINQSWSVKCEYLYMNFGKFTATNLDGDTLHAQEPGPHLEGRPELSLGRIQRAGRRPLLRSNNKRTSNTLGRPRAGPFSFLGFFPAQFRGRPKAGARNPWPYTSGFHGAHRFRTAAIRAALRADLDDGFGNDARHAFP